jgi:hypothetical protein
VDLPLLPAPPPTPVPEKKVEKKKAPKAPVSRDGVVDPFAN